MVTIEIDGVELEAAEGSMLIEVADKAGIKIPRFCYHEKLSIAANCRMCLVDVEKAPKPLPACATPVMDGMKVRTRSERALTAQKNVMEFLLINHPLDCPVCDQGGECELQDLSIGYGKSVSRYNERKRVIQDRNIGPLITTELTRCIHCTRCVRFGQEIAGIQELGMTGRGEFSQIGTFLSQSVDSELSGNVIDLCPVGALTSKPFRFSARSWELSCRDGIAAHDSVGSNITFHVQHDQVKRVVPRNNEKINENWISDRDRFSYTGLTHSDRLLSPKVKQAGQWTYTDWPTALRFVADKLKAIAKNKADRIGALISSNASVEEMYLTQKLMRGLGSNNIDFRLRQGDFSHQSSHPRMPGLATSLEVLEQTDVALLVGSNIRKDQPLIGHRIRKAVERGARVYVQNPVDFDFNFAITDKVIVSPEECLVKLAALVNALIAGNKKRTPKGLRPLLKTVKHNEQDIRWVEDLKSAKHGVILLGNLAIGHPAFGSLMQLADVLAGLTGCTLSFLPEAANSVGGWVAGCLPHRGVLGADVTTNGYHAQDMLNQPMDAYVLSQVEVEADCWDGHAALKAMYAAECVICLTAYETPLMRDYADVLLPVAAAYETSGSRINAQGDWQSFSAVVPAPGEARPSWKVLRVLANLMDLNDFDYQSTTEIYDEVNALVGDVSVSNTMEWQCPDSLSSPLSAGEGMPCVSPISLYSTDALVRRATDLQQTRDAKAMDPVVRAHPDTLNGLGLQGKNIEVLVGMAQDSQTLSVCADERVAENCVMIPVNHQHPGHLSDGMYRSVQLRKI